MKLNLSNPQTGQQKVITVENEHKIMGFYDKRMGMEVDGAPLGDEFANHTFAIAGGNDLQGFPMMQGVLTKSRVRLLFSKGMPTYRERRNGMRKKKSVRGCIVGPELSILNLKLTAIPAGAAQIEGLTDGSGNKRLGPKRATKIRAMVGLENKKGKNGEPKADPRKIVARRMLEDKDGKKRGYKAVKIQRLVTPRRLQHKRFRRSQTLIKVRKNQVMLKEYRERLHQHKVDAKEKRHAEVAKKKKKTVKKA